MRATDEQRSVGSGLDVTVRLSEIVFDTTSPLELAEFWGRALHWQVDGSGGDAMLVPTDGVTGFSVRFRRVDAPKVGQNRIHFDLTTRSLDDQERTVADLVAHGGRHIDIGQTAADDHVVLADPEGNELCVLAPNNRFLASCPRLGAVNCDGTHALGVFASRALGWPLVWDEGEETAIQAPEGSGPKVTWSGPPLMPVPPKERVHLHLAPAPGVGVAAALDHLVALGASRRESDHTMHACPDAIALSDVDGNEICLIGS